MANDKDTTKRVKLVWRRLAIAALIFTGGFAVGYVTAMYLLPTSIPTCDSCELTIDPNVSTTAKGRMTQMTKPYSSAYVRIYAPGYTETSVDVPILGQDFTMSSLPILRSKAATKDCAYLRLCYKAVFSVVCDYLPLSCN